MHIIINNIKRLFYFIILWTDLLNLEAKGRSGGQKTVLIGAQFIFWFLILVLINSGDTSDARAVISFFIVAPLAMWGPIFVPMLMFRLRDNDLFLEVKNTLKEKLNNHGYKSS